MTRVCGSRKGEGGEEHKIHGQIGEGNWLEVGVHWKGEAKTATDRKG